MQVRFARRPGGIRLYVVPEDDADRIALGQFLVTFGDGKCVAVVEADWHGGHGFDGSAAVALGPSFLAFGAAQITVEPG